MTTCKKSIDSILQTRQLPDFPSMSLGYHLSAVFDGNLYVLGGVSAVYDEVNDDNISQECRIVHRQKAFPEHKTYIPLHCVFVYKPQICSWSVHQIQSYTDCLVGDDSDNPGSVNFDFRGIENSATVVHNQKLYVFGGWTGHAHSNSMWTFDLRTYEIVKITFEEGSMIPTPRAGHTMDLISQHEFLVFGGQGGGINKSNEFPLKSVVESEKYEMDVYNNQQLSFDCDTFKWTLLDESSREEHLSPCARAYHSCTRVKEKLYLFGGRNRESGEFDH